MPYQYIREGNAMKQDLYYKIVDYIIENQNKFYRLAYSYVQNQDDAMDVVQSAIYNALENYGALRNENAVKTWFYRILVNESLLLKKKQKESLLGETEKMEIYYYERGYDITECPLEEMDCLDEDTQTIIKLRFFEELPLKEISDITKMNLNTVKAKLYRGLKLLKENLVEAEA